MSETIEFEAFVHPRRGGPLIQQSPGLWLDEIDLDKGKSIKRGRYHVTLTLVSLKACPFAEGDEKHVLKVVVYDPISWCVQCQTCKANGPAKRTRQMAIDAWNRRGSDAREH